MPNWNNCPIDLFSSSPAFFPKNSNDIQSLGKEPLVSILFDFIYSRFSSKIAAANGLSLILEYLISLSSNSYFDIKYLRTALSTFSEISFFFSFRTLLRLNSSSSVAFPFKILTLKFSNSILLLNFSTY